MELSPEEKERFVAWVIAHVDERIVPCDEGNSAALIYNLVHLIRGDQEKYDYRPHQNDELESMGFARGDNDLV